MARLARLVPRLASWWSTVFRARALAQDLDDELRATVETLADRFMSDGAEGMTREAAQRAALEALGGTAGVVRVREDVRDGRIGAGVESLLLDARHAWRGLRRARGLTAVIVITLALGIGANTAIFSIVHAMLLEPLPYPDADRLAFIWLDRSDVGYPRGPLSGPDLHDLRQQNTTFAEIGAIWASGSVALTDGGQPEELRTAYVTSNFFQVIGVEPALGRTFVEGDSSPDAPSLILIGWDLFSRRFHGDPSLVGRQIMVNDVPTTVVGVMPPSFRLLLPQDSSVPDRLQVWRPFWHGVEQNPRGHLLLRVVGRMRSGVGIDRARADVDAIGRSIGEHLGVSRTFTTVGLQADGVRDVRGPLVLLFVGVAILLTIACVNIAGLLAARAAARAKETALRLALGASRMRLLRQSLLEGLCLALLGGAAGVLTGFVSLQVLIYLAPPPLARIGAARIDAAVLAFTFGIALTWGLLFSLAPATELFKKAVGRARVHARAALVVAQIGASLVLLIGAGLLARTFGEVQRIDPGFAVSGRLTVRVALPQDRYDRPDVLVAAARRLEDVLAAIPGVTRVGAISHLPYDDLPNWYLTYGLEKSSSDNGVAKADARVISPGLFQTLDVRLLDGRWFAGNEPRGVLPVIVDEMLARDVWPGRRAVGQQFMIGQASPEFPVTVVGVVRHLRMRSLVEDLTPQVFIPYASWQRTPMAFVLQTDRDLDAIAADVRAAVAVFDPQLPVFDVRPLGDYLDSAWSVRRFTMILAATFAAVALLLTCVGVYGVLAYSVTIRRHEIGVRRALGAGTRQVIWNVLREGFACAAIGSAGGLALSAGASVLLRSQLYGVHPRDPMTYTAAAALILAGAVLASLVPAYRASSISPMDALRSE